MYDILERLFCRDVDGCPSRSIPHGDLLTQLQDRRVKREIMKPIIYVSRTRLCCSIAGRRSRVAENDENSRHVITFYSGFYSPGRKS